MDGQDERDIDELMEELETAICGILPEGIEFTLLLYVRSPGAGVVMMHDGGGVSSLPDNLVGTMAMLSVRNMPKDKFADPESN